MAQLAEDIHKELLEDMDQMKQQIKEHRTFSHEIGCMASFIVECRPEVATQGDKIKEEAQAAFDKSVKDEREIEEKLNAWKRSNKKWLKRKKKEKGKEKIENATGGEGPKGSNSRLVEKLCRDLKPNFLLADDGNLQNKNVWKKAMQTYTGYLSDEMEITPKLYYDLFSNLCDTEIQKHREHLSAN